MDAKPRQRQQHKRCSSKRKRSDAGAGIAHTEPCIYYSPRESLLEEKIAIYEEECRLAAARPQQPKQRIPFDHELRGHLISAVETSLKGRSDQIEALKQMVVDLAQTFLTEEAASAEARLIHESVRSLIFLCERKKPNFTSIRNRAMNLHSDMLHEMNIPARLSWEKHAYWSGKRCFGGHFPPGGFLAWFPTAPDDELVEAIKVFAMSTWVEVPGRKRNGVIGPARWEPVILGYVRGSRRQLLTQNQAVALSTQPSRQSNGRPPCVEVDRLFRNLAMAWIRVLGKQSLQRGRSMSTPFGVLVSDVFTLLGLKHPEQAFRRYWNVVTPDVEFGLSNGLEVG